MVKRLNGKCQIGLLLSVILFAGCESNRIEQDASSKAPALETSVKDAETQQSTVPPELGDRDFIITAPSSMPSLSPVESPASLLRDNTDGTWLIKIKPHVYVQEQQGLAFIDGMGFGPPGYDYKIWFSIMNQNYYSTLHREPIHLDREKEYKFLVKTDSHSFWILTIWDENEIIYQKDKEK